MPDTAIDFRAPGMDIDVSEDLARAKRLLTSAGTAAERLREDIAELVEMRAWQVLGYPNFPDMWEAEVGYKCPRAVLIMGVESIRGERGSNRTVQYSDGLKNHDIAVMFGLRLNDDNDNKSSVVSAIFRQLDAGVEPGNVVLRSGGVFVKQAIARAQPRRLGAAPDEPVTFGFQLPRKYDDAMDGIARDRDVPKAEIYRQAVADYLARTTDGTTPTIPGEGEV